MKHSEDNVSTFPMQEDLLLLEHSVYNSSITSNFRQTKTFTSNMKKKTARMIACQPCSCNK